jgi:anti-sigma factor RsiW
MNASGDDTWPPSPELLAAYFDGEFEGRDDLVDVRRRLEDWLAADPGARAELAEYRRLRHLWQETTPREPAVTAWQNLLRRLESCPVRAGSLSRGAGSHAPWKMAAVLAGAAGFLLAAVLLKDSGTARDDMEPFPVASEREVVILYVEGADTGTLVVGQLPLQGPMELVDAGDVTLTSVEPAQRDNMVPDVHIAGPGRPIIWARAEGEDD